MPDPTLRDRLIQLVEPYVEMSADATIDVLLAGEEWQAREAVVEAVAECLDDLGLLGLHTDEPDCAACRTRVRLLDGCARLTAVRRRT